MARASIGRCVALSLLALLARSAGAQQRATSDSAEAVDYREAVSVLQGDDSASFLDTTRIRLVERALRAIRADIPQVADIREDKDRASLMIFPADSAKDAFATRAGVTRPVGQGIWNVTVPRVGIPAIDSLNRQFGVTSIHITGVGGMSVLYLHFRRPMNLPIVGQHYARVPQVSSAGPDFDWGLGNPDWITLLPKAHRLHFVFARGSGDCPSGCIDWDYHYVTYDTVDGSVVLERERLHTTKWADPISYWDIPTRYSINPYPTLDSLFKGLHETRWWYRAHAVHVLGILLGKSIGPWHGAGEQSQAHFDALKAEVRDRRRASLEALIERLTDPDSDVASYALAYLRQVSGRAMPGGAAGVASWQQWLRESQ